ncbi:MAG: hypothetical protein IPH88_19715 [Bacteroidales bacterium]|nr:hypothetical protein [Bacteroidales bacterium]
MRQRTRIPVGAGTGLSPPTPMTLARLLLFWDSSFREAVYTARSKDEKLEQRQFFFWYKPENRQMIRKNLSRIGEEKLADRLLGGVSRKGR